MASKRQKHWTGDVATLLRVGPGFRLDRVDAEETPGYRRRKKDGRCPRLQTSATLQRSCSARAHSPLTTISTSACGVAIEGAITQKPAMNIAIGPVSGSGAASCCSVER